jgi:hypothetical protein
VSALDDRIDDLYKGPLADFTSARNALAKTLSGEQAKHVKALAKPTVVPWAINQLYWHARKTYERLLDRGARLRKAQIAALSGKSAALREATDAQRAALAEAVREASRLGGIGAQHRESLTRTLESLSLAAEPSQSPGRLTEVLQPAGFEALAGVTPHLRPLRKESPSPVRAELAPPAEDGRARAAEAAAGRKREAEIKQAEAAVERARAAEAVARQTLERATRERAEAEARLEQLQ